MPSITAKQVRKKHQKGERVNPKVVQHEAETDVSELNSTFDIWSIGFLDIETTGLGADFGHILGACIKPANHSKIRTFRIDSYTGYKKDLCNDKQLTLDIVKAMSDYDVVVHYNGDMFDLPFIDTRLAIHGEKRSPLIHSIDLLPIVKRKLRLHSNRLDAVATALGLTNQKTKLQPMVWQRASHGSKPDLDYIMEHCEADVLVLEEAFRRLKSYVDTIFRRR